jgi:hypothetical protein
VEIYQGVERAKKWIVTDFWMQSRRTSLTVF